MIFRQSKSKNAQKTDEKMKKVKSKSLDHWKLHILVYTKNQSVTISQKIYLVKKLFVFAQILMTTNV